MIRLADYIINRLYEETVKHIFMVTGRGILYLSDAVAKHGCIKSICVHHEQAASYAAVAYAQYNEKLGACLVSTGCAGTNALTGVLSAWQDGVPCIFISGQNMLRETTRFTGLPIRTFGQQEADIVKLVEPITKYATMITDPKQIAYEMDKAIHLASTGRKGPVWIDVPLDIQNARIIPEELERFQPGLEDIPKATADDLDYIVNALQMSQRPVILIGNGVRSAGAVDELETLVGMLQIPVTFASSAVDAYGAGHRLSIGAVGSIGGTRAGNFAVQNCDLLLVLGCRLSPVTTGSDYKNFARAAQIIVVDIDCVEHSKNTVRIDRLILSDVKYFISNLLDRKINIDYSQWLAKCTHWKVIFPFCEDGYKKTELVDIHYLADCLTNAISEKAVILCDAGFEELIIPAAVRFGKGQRCIHPASQGAMGYALPAAIGAYLASGQQTLAVIGDGSIMMNLQELQTIRHYNIPVKIFVVNNNVYAVIRKRQKDLFRTRTIGTDGSNGVTCPDFKSVSECFNLPYFKIDSSNELKANINDVLDMDGPVLCEIMAVHEQEYLRSAHGYTSIKRFVQKPLEDQAPFLERELFLSEMIISPLD